MIAVAELILMLSKAVAAVPYIAKGPTVTSAIADSANAVETAKAIRFLFMTNFHSIG